MKIWGLLMVVVLSVFLVISTPPGTFRDGAETSLLQDNSETPLIGVQILQTLSLQDFTILAAPGRLYKLIFIPKQRVQVEVAGATLNIKAGGPYTNYEIVIDARRQDKGKKSLVHFRGNNISQIYISMEIWENGQWTTTDHVNFDRQYLGNFNDFLVMLRSDRSPPFLESYKGEFICTIPLILVRGASAVVCLRD